MAAKPTPPPWPEFGCVYVYATTARPGLHDPYTNPYVGWVVASGGDREFEANREVHSSKRAAQRWAEQRWSIKEWISVSSARSMIAAVPKNSPEGGAPSPTTLLEAEPPSGDPLPPQEGATPCPHPN